MIDLLDISIRLTIKEIAQANNAITTYYIPHGYRTIFKWKCRDVSYLIIRIGFVDSISSAGFASRIYKHTFYSAIISHDGK